MPVITISRQYGSYGDAVADLLRDRLGYRILDRDLMRRLATQAGLKPGKVINLSEDQYQPRTLADRFLENAAPPPRNPGAWADYRSASARDRSAAELVAQLIVDAYEQDNVVVLGRGGQVVLGEKPDVLHVRLTAPLEMRIRRHQIRAGLTVEAARAEVLERDEASAEFIKRYYGVDVADPTLYDLIINTGKLSLDAAADLIIMLLRALPARA
jgi:cytidylate kinase